MDTLKVSLVTPTKQVVRVEAAMLTAPSVMGEVGILPDHRPLLADLNAGSVTIKTDAGVESYAIAGGFLEVDRNHVTLLAEAAEAATDIDVDRARAALKDAETKLAKLEYNSPEHNEEWARARRARVRLFVAGAR